VKNHDFTPKKSYPPLVYNENVPQKWWIKKKIKKGGSTNRVPMFKSTRLQKFVNYLPLL
jgi:hypothetical protein